MRTTRSILSLTLLAICLPAVADPAVPAKGLEERLRAYFILDPSARKDADVEDARYGEAGRDEAKSVRALAMQAYREGEKIGAMTQEYGDGGVSVGKYTMPFFIEKRGEKPEGGWPVVIAMHGGGGAPKAVNDSQWEHMKRRYRISNCLYIAPRAPTDEWNGFYTDYVYPLVDRLLRLVNVFEETNPDRVYILGYSHGGYGAFAIGPKMPDRFAAIHSSAGAATDGQVAAETLMNVRFTYMIGEQDTAYGRLDRCRQFDTRIKELQQAHPGLFPVELLYQPGRQHSNLPDLQIPQEMAKHTRNPVPRKLHWVLTDGVIREFYWLAVDQPGPGKSVQATCEGNTITLTTQNIERLTLYLDDRLVDMSKPVTVVANGKTVFEGRVKRSLATLCRTLESRGDPGLAFDAELKLTDLGEKAK